MFTNDIEFQESYNEKSNSGYVEEFEKDYENYTEISLRSLQFAKNIEDGTITITGMEVTDDYHYNYLDATVVIPEKIMGAPVTAISDYASGNTTSDVEISAVVLPETLKSVGVAAFADMGAFKTVEIPASVTEIGEYAFGYFRDEARDGTESFEKIDDFVIECYPGTAAEKYAKDNGFEYKLLQHK